MKAILKIVLTTLVLFSSIALYSQSENIKADESIPLTIFTDDKLQNILRNYDLDGNSVLSATEITNIQALTIDGNINLTGLENLSSLEDITISNNNLITNYSNNNNAVLKSITISNCSQINAITTYNDSNLESVNFNNLAELKTLNIGNDDSTPNKVEKLDLSTLPKLENLNARVCRLKSLDISNNPNLNTLDVCHNYFFFIKGFKEFKHTGNNCARNQTFVFDATYNENGLQIDLSKYEADGLDLSTIQLLVSQDGNSLTTGASYDSSTGIITITDPSLSFEIVQLAGDGASKVQTNTKGTYNISYKVDFYNGDTLYNTQTVNSGGSVTTPDNPLKSGYEFIGWDKQESIYKTPTSYIRVNALFKVIPVKPIKDDNKISNNSNNNSIASLLDDLNITPLDLQLDDEITIDITSSNTNNSSQSNSKKSNSSKDINEQTGTTNGYKSSGQGIENIKNDISHVFDNDCIYHILEFVLLIIYLIYAIMNKVIFKKKNIFNIISLLFILLSFIFYMLGTCSLDLVMFIINSIGVVILKFLNKNNDDNKQGENG
ncbi:MAG: InlB B-repeat-containing protein [Thomasclavelia sp.]|nr:InlB B-repeat-containing protein [Thomasclavelia sp.]